MSLKQKFSQGEMEARSSEREGKSFPKSLAFAALGVGLKGKESGNSKGEMDQGQSGCYSEAAGLGNRMSLVYS